MTFKKYFQKTLAHEVSFEGDGLFTGQHARVVLKPQEPNTGIIFQRSDLETKPLIEASVENVKNVIRCTLLEKNGASVQTTEHLLSALAAFEIDNLLIEISGPEVPILDGSAYPFVQLIEKAKVQEQKEEKIIFTLDHPIYYSKDEVQIVAIPSDHYQVSYTLNYPHSEFLDSQFYTFNVNPKLYREEVAQARTFSLYEEIQPLLDRGIIKGGGLHNALIIKDNRVLNQEGMRFEDEPVRHKVLDLLGDLSLVGTRFCAHVMAIRSGHKGNTSFAKILKQSMREHLDVQTI